MEKIIVIGGGGHAKVVISILKKINSYVIEGYTDIQNLGPILGVPFIGSDDILGEKKYNDGVGNLALGIGQLKSSKLRIDVINKLQPFNYSFPIIISPNSSINEDVLIEEGSVVMDGVVINSGSKIGKYSIINTNSSIDHDCTIGSYTHIAPGVTLSGGVEIGNHSLIGTGSNIIQYIKITDNTVVGAGSTVVNSALKPGIYIGNPAIFYNEKK